MEANDFGAESPAENFIVKEVEKDLTSGRFKEVRTRFAPEPNAYIHIGSAFSISITYGVAERFGGTYTLRFDDTNPTKEKVEYVESIKEDIRWLGYDWQNREFYASDYFEQLYDWAVELIQTGKAYVCDLTEEEIKTYRGTNSFDENGNHITEPGRNSPYRNRTVKENLELFEAMRNGEFDDGSRTLRAKIDMNHRFLIMRDPVMYRIMHVVHQRTGNTWSIFPTYDWAHGQSDSIERISHSICAAEFRHHRPLYDWFLDQLEIFHPRQIEYPRIKLTQTVLSKRFLVPIVESGHVSGWDDPRLPTLRGLRRRGIPPEVIREFCNRIPIAESKYDSRIDIRHFEHSVRGYLNKVAPRLMAVLNPIKVVITNYPEDEEELIEAHNNPEDESAGTRMVPFSRELYIERDDFMENPPPKFYRLGPGREVRLRYAYFVTCNHVEKDAEGNVRVLHCTYDPETKGGNSPDGRKVKATLHWLSAAHAVEIEVRLFEHLFTKDDAFDVEEGNSWLENLNPNSLNVLTNCYAEPAAAELSAGRRCQFERLGYFCVDPASRKDHGIFNRTISLRDSWKRIEADRKHL